MARVNSPPQVNRRQPLLKDKPCQEEKTRFSEVAGGTAAGCAAICCCCPCALMNLLVLAVYRVPAGLCRKAWKKNKRRRLKKKGLLQKKAGPTSCCCDEMEVREPTVGVCDEENETVDLENKMWDQFTGTGFWRSTSQRDAEL